MAHDAHAPTLERKAPHLNTSEHKKVGWLELFYDLVYVATIVQLGNKLSEDVSVEGFISFALLFIPIWWVWMGTTFYYTRFNADDLVHRGLVFLQIVTISALAISVYDGLGETSVGFAIAYAVARLLLVAMYLRASYFVPQARVLANRYAIGFASAAALWLISVFVPPPLRFVLWIVGLLIDFGTPLSPASVRLQRKLPPSAHHLPERMGLFTIIVFGESFIKVIGGYTGHAIEASTALIGFLGLVVVGGLWWIYNETVAERGVVWRRAGVQTYIYGHLPLQLSLVMLAVGIYKLVTQHSDVLPDKYRLLVAGAVALCLVAQGVVEFWTDRGNRRLDLVLRLIAAAIALAIGVFASGMHEVLLIGVLSVLVLVLAVVDLADENRPADTGETPELELSEE
ncbi:MAG: low temperature requirement protein A [Anaerolineae bacterium]|nr:low temperature requirement protein A [Anaerolineae bacterium]NUQ05753.1 low temperature requirement protein A [Anaerolineae bacterium]